MPTALITGVTGQDGQHLAELLHSKGYEVFGVVAGQPSAGFDVFSSEFPYGRTIHGDLGDLSSLVADVDNARPDEVYNLGAISFVGIGWGQDEYTADTTGLGVV